MSADLGLITTGAVGMAAWFSPWITARLGAKREKDARQQQRMDELRDVLDGACKALMEAMRTASSLGTSPQTLPAGRWDELMADLRTALDTAWGQEAMIAVRVGTAAPLYFKHHAALDVLGSIYGNYRQLRVDPSMARSEIATLALERMPAAFGEFFDEAAKRVGTYRD